MTRFTINLHNIDGVKLFSYLMSQVHSEADICVGRYIIDAKSIMGLFSLTLDQDVVMVIHERVDGEAEKIYQMMKDNGFLVEEA